MKTRVCRTQADLDKAGADIQNLGDNLPCVVSVASGRGIRTTKQNSRYWAILDEWLGLIRDAIMQIADDSGHSPAEVRRIVANEMTAEYVEIIYARTTEAAHSCLKEIWGVDTTTRMGTKDFMDHETKMDSTMAEVFGEVQTVV